MTPYEFAEQLYSRDPTLLDYIDYVRDYENPGVGITHIEELYELITTLFEEIFAGRYPNEELRQMFDDSE